MRFELTETQKQIEKNARQFLANECPINEVRRLMEAPTAFDKNLWSKMSDQGWPGMIFPEEFGGMAMGLIEMVVTFEQMGKALLPGPFLSTTVAGTIVNSAGTVDQKKKYLDPICAGSTRSTVALVEETGEWDPASWSTTSTNGRITGRKMFVMDAAEAEFFVVSAVVNGELGLFAVARDQATIVPMSAMDLTRKMYVVSFENAEAEFLALGATAHRALDYGLDIANTALCAEMVGGMQRVLDITVAYAKARKQFDQPIGKFQAVQHMCADMLMWTESSRSAVYYAAYALERQLPEAQSAVSVAKVYAADSYREVGNRGIQIHGGMGFTWENDVHLYYRRAKVSETAFGDVRHHRERIARLIIDERIIESPSHVPAIPELAAL